MTRKGGYATARSRFKLAGVTCALCPAPAAERHHRDRDPENNTRANVVPLCRACHKRLHPPPVNNPGWRAMLDEKRARTHCPAGHPYSPENTRTSRQGTRSCRTCEAAKMRAYRAQRAVERGTRRGRDDDGRFAAVPL